MMMMTRRKRRTKMKKRTRKRKRKKFVVFWFLALGLELVSDHILQEQGQKRCRDNHRDASEDDPDNKKISSENQGQAT
jgi:hypothetical protein